METPEDLALEVAVLLDEWAEKTLVSTPAIFIRFFNQCPIVGAFTGLNGFFTDMNSGLCGDVRVRKPADLSS